MTAALQSEHILYCEEHLVLRSGAQTTVAVAVIPLVSVEAEEERALLLFRLKEGGTENAGFRHKLVEDASKLHAANLGSRPVQISG